MLGEIVGVKENSVRNAVNVIKSGNKEIIKKCRTGSMSLYKANNTLFGVHKSGKGEKHTVWKSYSKIKCPSCSQIHERKEYKLVR